MPTTSYNHIGPSHMRTFAEDEVVQEKFINAALSRSVLPAAADTGYIL